MSMNARIAIGILLAAGLVLAAAPSAGAAGVEVCAHVAGNGGCWSAAAGGSDLCERHEAEVPGVADASAALCG